MSTTTSIQHLIRITIIISLACANNHVFVSAAYSRDDNAYSYRSSKSSKSLKMSYKHKGRGDDWRRKKGQDYSYGKYYNDDASWYYNTKGKGRSHYKYPHPTTSHPVTPTLETKCPQMHPTSNPTLAPTDYPTTDEHPVRVKRMLVNMKGANTGERLEFPDTTSDLQLLCFNSLPLYDLNTNQTIGEGSNCISFTATNNDTIQLNIVSETTTFALEKCDTKLTFVLVPTFAPIQQGPTGFVVSTTWQQAPSNNIIYSANECGFTEDTTGSVRLSGFVIVDAIQSTFSFDYMYVIDFMNKTAEIE